MSLILDALNRSRDEVEPVPNLATQHPIERVTSRLPPYVAWLGLALVLLMILVLVLRMAADSLDKRAESSAPVVELTENIGSAASALTNELKARAENRRGAADPTGQVVETRAELIPVAAVAGSAQKNPAEKTAGERIDPPDPAIAQLYRDKDKLQASDQRVKLPAVPEPKRSRVPEEEIIDIEEVLERAQREMENTDLVDHPVPFLGALSQRAKDEIPTIYYQKHDYSSDAGVSSVTLNGKTVKVGGSPLAGLKVDEILSDSVILTYRDSQFRLRALNSWVNL